MQANRNILKLRIQWFNWQAKEFVGRYFMGLLILVILLPGVGIGENFNNLMSAIVKPFSILSLSQASFLDSLIWIVLLIVVFVVWARAQRHAINGGEFSVFQQSLPIQESFKKSINIIMLLIGNHFLWPFIIASYFYISAGDGNVLLVYTRNTFLILLLLMIQYQSLFQNRSKGYLFYSLIVFSFIFPISSSFEIVRMVFVFVAMFVFAYYQLYKEPNNTSLKNKTNLLKPIVFKKSFYFQILFKSGLTSSLFRLSIIAGFFIGFIYAVDYWVKDYLELTPYYLVLEAVLAYFISGFYVSFLDQRKTMQALLLTLPIKFHFWFIRDVFVVLLLSLVLHLPFYYFALKLSDSLALAYAFIYHLILIITCYPIRILVTEKQTFITFVVLFIITAITIFNLP